MIVVATGIIIRRDPGGFNVVAWHRHEALEKASEPSDFYEELTELEMVDVVLAHLATYAVGEDCRICRGWSQPSLWGGADRPEGM